MPCRLRVLGIFGTSDSVLKLTRSPQAKRAESDPRQGTPTSVIIYDIMLHCFTLNSNTLRDYVPYEGAPTTA